MPITMVCNILPLDLMMAPLHFVVLICTMISSSFPPSWEEFIPKFEFHIGGSLGGTSSGNTSSYSRKKKKRKSIALEREMLRLVRVMYDSKYIRKNIGLFKYKFSLTSLVSFFLKLDPSFLDFFLSFSFLSKRSSLSLFFTHIFFLSTHGFLYIDLVLIYLR